MCCPDLTLKIMLIYSLPCLCVRKKIDSKPNTALQWFLTTCTSQTRSYSEDKHFQKEYTAALLILSYLLLQHCLYLNSSDSEKIKHTCLTWEKLLVHSVLDKTIPKGGKPNIIFFFLLFLTSLLTFSASQEKMLAAEQHFPHGWCALSADESSCQVFWDDHNLTCPCRNQCRCVFVMIDVSVFLLSALNISTLGLNWDT